MIMNNVAYGCPDRRSRAELGTMQQGSTTRRQIQPYLHDHERKALSNSALADGSRDHAETALRAGVSRAISA
jgi:hypothetical protein